MYVFHWPNFHALNSVIFLPSNLVILFTIKAAVTLHLKNNYIDGLVQDCSNSSALAMELLQSCTKSSIYLISICLFLRNKEGHFMPFRLETYPPKPA